jgi:hypothetical protein
MTTKRTLLILILAVVIALGFLIWRSLNSLKEKHAITGVIHELEAGIATQNEQLVKSLYSENIRSGKTVEHAGMINEFLSMKEIQHFRISDIDIALRKGSAVAHFRVTGEMVRDGETVGGMNKKMAIQLSKSTGKWLVVGHAM